MTANESPISSRQREEYVKGNYARGFADGSAVREWRLSITTYQSVGNDEYSKGFRAGYYNKDRRAGQTRARATL